MAANLVWKFAKGKSGSTIQLIVVAGGLQQGYSIAVATLELTDEQVIELASQLPADKQQALLGRLAQRAWPRWTELSDYAQQRARTMAADRGQDWEAMSEAERQQFIDVVLHEA